MWKFILLFLLVLQIKAWKENQVGDHELNYFESLIRTTEKEYSDQTNLVCSNKFGLGFWEKLKSSRKKVCRSMTTFNHNGFGVLLMENVSLTSDETKVDYWDTPYLDSHIVMSGDCDAEPPKMYQPFFQSIRHQSRLETKHQCQKWIEDPVFILPWFDSTNWWHFDEFALFPSFLFYSIVQPDLLKQGREVQTFTLRWPAKTKFNTRGKGVYPRWVALPEVIEKMIGPMRVVPSEPLHNTCFRKVAWYSVSMTHLNIQKLNLDRGKCFSSVFRAASDLARGVMGLPVVTHPGMKSQHKRPVKIVYVKRKPTETWSPHQSRRNLGNQEDLITFFTQNAAKWGYEFESLEFYYENMKNAQEQMLAIGQADVLIGVHGAGLGAMVSLPPGSIVVEIRSSAGDAHFEHLAHFLGLHYVHHFPRSFSTMPAKDMNTIWTKLQQEISNVFKS